MKFTTRSNQEEGDSQLVISTSDSSAGENTAGYDVYNIQDLEVEVIPDASGNAPDVSFADLSVDIDSVYDVSAEESVLPFEDLDPVEPNPSPTPSGGNISKWWIWVVIALLIIIIILIIVIILAKRKQKEDDEYMPQETPKVVAGKDYGNLVEKGKERKRPSINRNSYNRRV